MKNLKTTILSAFIALCCLTNGNAQTSANAQRGLEGRSPGFIVSLGGGISIPSSDGKDKAFLSNTTTMSLDACIPLTKRGWGPNGNWFGVNIGGAYNFGGKGGFGTTPNPYAVTGQTSSVVSDRGVDPKSPGFRMGAGPQANFYFGKFIVSPMVLGEYFSMTQKEMSIVQTTQYNGKSYDFNLATLPETKTSGFAITPKLRLQYMISEHFGLFADASYTTGPKMETTVSKLIPNGNPNPQSSSYNIQQLQTGTMVKGETKSTAYSAMGFNFGIVIGLGSQRGPCPGPHCDDKVEKMTKADSGIEKQESKIAGDGTKATGGTPTGKTNTDDIRKGWNGKIEDLFKGNYADIVVAKNGGVEKFIEQINKDGKGKASLVKYGENQYVEITTKEEVSYYPIDNSPQFTIINSGGLGCSNRTCSNCGPNSYGPCICNPSFAGDGVHPYDPVSCGSSITHSITDYFASANHDVISTLLETDDNGHLTTTSVKNIEHLLLAQMPHATAIKSELKKEDNLSYVETQFTDKEKGFVLISKLGLEGKRLVVIKNNLMMCAGSCNGTTYDCSLNGWGSVGVHVYCNCGTGCRFKIIDFPNPISLGGGVKNVDLEQLIMIDGH